MSFGTEYCAGFVDVHGQWNNGFYCPKWGDPDMPYCCGDEHDRYCCTAVQHPHLHRVQQQQQRPRYHHQQPDQPNDVGQSTDLPSQGAQHATGPIYYQYAIHLGSFTYGRNGSNCYANNIGGLCVLGLCLLCPINIIVTAEIFRLNKKAPDGIGIFHLKCNIHT